MFGLNKKKESSEETTNSAHTDSAQSLPKGHNPAKGAPTPRRKDVEAANRRPIVSDASSMTKDQKKAKKAEERRHSNLEFAKQQEAMKTGDEKNYPYQHQGPERSFGRDYVDASAPLSAFFMPVAILLLVVIFLQTRLPKIGMILTIAIYLSFFAMIFNAYIIARRARDLAGYKFGWSNLPRGFFLQMMGRCFYMPNWRQPKPRVKRGQFPDGSSKEHLKAARKDKRAHKS